MIEASAGGEPKAEAMWNQRCIETCSFFAPVLIPAGKQGKGECLLDCFLVVKYKDRAFPLSVYTLQKVK